MKLTLEILPNNEVNTKKWDAFIAHSPQGALYATHGFATAIRPDWQAMIVKAGDEWKAVMPFCINEKFIYKYLPQPPFAQYWGVYFPPLKAKKNNEHFSAKKKILTPILEYLRSIDLVIQNFSPAFDYPLPFHWEGFELKMRYTYYLNLTASKSILYDRLDAALVRQIKKTKRNEIRLSKAENVHALLELVSLNKEKGHDLLAENEKGPEIVKRMFDYLHKGGKGHILEARTPDGQLLSAAFFARFGSKTYYLLGAYHPDFRSSGAMTRTLWEGILDAKERGSRWFDFEGSMIEGVEHFFRKFGAYPIPYLQIHKNQLPLPLQWIQGLRS